jgi:hypothetical protein
VPVETIPLSAADTFRSPHRDDSGKIVAEHIKGDLIDDVISELYMDDVPMFKGYLKAWLEACRTPRSGRSWPRR